MSEGPSFWRYIPPNAVTAASLILGLLAIEPNAEIGPVDFVLLDGWKELYLPVIKLLQPRLSPGALVIADNTESKDARSYLDYVQSSENGYVSFNFAVRDSDSMELSCYA